jgi:hypothetical protein
MKYASVLADIKDMYVKDTIAPIKTLLITETRYKKLFYLWYCMDMKLISHNMKRDCRHLKKGPEKGQEAGEDCVRRSITCTLTKY